MPKILNVSRILINAPVIGIACFIILFLYSTTLYPGGSQLNLNVEGFDWANNYWCDLMDENGINGAPNPAKPYSIIAMVILCFSLMKFFFRFAKVFAKSVLWKRIIPVSGVISMIFAALFFTKYHDIMIFLSSIFGLLTTVGIMFEIFRSEMNHYKTGGVICIVLLGLNNYIYYTHWQIEFLPILQKITFLIVIIWILGLNLKLTRILRINE